MQKTKKELIAKLKKTPLKNKKVVIMPHFCLDTFVHYDKEIKSFEKVFKELAREGGGNLYVKQTLTRGGKAANCASALSSLGITPFLIARTNEIGYILLKHFFKNRNINLSHVIRDGKLAFTSIIELTGTNVMFSDPGSLSEFGPNKLTEKNKKLISEADLVYISDWGLNQKGTDLTKYVFNIVKKNKKGKTFFDPGDPTPKKSQPEAGQPLAEKTAEEPKSEVDKLIDEIILKERVDILSVNDGELKKYGRSNSLRTAANYLRGRTRVDLHAENYVKSFYKNKETDKIPAFKVKPKRLTGAGDSWNAGDIYGELLGFSDELRLLLANAVSAFYISSPEGKHPTRQELIKFIEKTPLKK